MIKQYFTGVINAVHRILATLAICVLLFSCTQERQPCLTPTTAGLNVNCVHRLNDSVQSIVDTGLPRAFWGALTAKGTQYFYYKDRTANFTLSLSPDADTCSWIMTTDSLTYAFDTLSFRYQRKLQFLSNACGYAYFYSINAVSTTHNNIDSVVITNPSVTNDAKIKQLKIYIRSN